jgi:hypothetical protein
MRSRRPLREPGDAREDVIGALGPDERLRIGVMGFVPAAISPEIAAGWINGRRR